MSIPWRISRLVFAEMANAKDLAKVLKPFAAEHGLSFVKYDEAEKCKDAKTLTAELKQHKELLFCHPAAPKNRIEVDDQRCDRGNLRGLQVHLEARR